MRIHIISFEYPDKGPIVAGFVKFMASLLSFDMKTQSTPIFLDEIAFPQFWMVLLVTKIIHSDK